MFWVSLFPHLGFHHLSVSFCALVIRVGNSIFLRIFNKKCSITPPAHTFSHLLGLVRLFMKLMFFMHLESTISLFIIHMQKTCFLFQACNKQNHVSIDGLPASILVGWILCRCLVDETKGHEHKSKRTLREVVEIYQTPNNLNTRDYIQRLPVS